MKRVHDSLNNVFSRNRLVFWYDPEHQWTHAFETFANEGVNKIKVEGTEFGTKVAIHRNPDLNARYLLYFPSARPKDPDNWLLDLLLQGHEFKADRASLALQEVGLPYDFRELVMEHVGFYESPKRLQSFREIISADEDSSSLRLKMMAVLAKTEPDIDALLLGFLAKGDSGSLFDPVEECLGQSNLVESFWREIGIAFGYANEKPSLRDFVTALFRWADPMDNSVVLDPHTRVFLQRWKDSQSHSFSFREWSAQMETDLHVAEKLGGQDNIRDIETSDTFPLFEKYIVHWLYRSFEKGTAGASLQSIIQKRRNSFWFADHNHGYSALEQAILLRELLEAAELQVESIAAGVNRYVSSWHRIDTAYRRFQYHVRNYAQVAVTEKVAEWAEKSYVNNFLLPLADRWSDQVRAMAEWSCEGVPQQTAFFTEFVQPFLNKGQKVFVVVSDAFRYEVAAEFAGRLRDENRWTADLSVMLGSLPSYTQLGMAALLPGTERSVQLPEGTVYVDGRNSSGTDNRTQILAAAVEGKAIAVQAEEFLEMNTKTEARALLKDHEVVYIFHNCIDKVGDVAATEAKTAAAVESTFDELMQVLRKIANANGNNMLLTADHGFLFQQSEVDEADDLPLPAAASWHYRNRRFALGQGVVTDARVKLFTAVNLGLSGDWSAAFPLSLGRFPLQGSGKRYVHGGVSLQEVVIPVLRIHKARSDDTERVEVDLLRVPAKITTGQVSLALYQDRPVADKILPRALFVGLYAADGTPLSEQRALTFDSADAEPRQRETALVLTLSRSADDFNNQDVELRLEENIPGTNQRAVYRSHRIKLQKPFAGDFDDF